MNTTLTEFFGYLASLVLMISFSMKDIRKLRLINSTGCIFFVIYGFMLQTAWPIIISNGFILGMNVWHLRKSAGK